MPDYALEYGFAEPDRQSIVALLREYETGLGISLCFQNFDAEVAGLPGDYAPPAGELVLARRRQGRELIGCVAVRPHAGAPDMCEMKRLYVRSPARGTGLGRALALAAMEAGRRLGYARMGLDTLSTMLGAQALYRSLGFRQTGVGATEPKVLLFERHLERGA